MQIKTLTSNDYKKWDSFVDSCPNATFFHKSAWQPIIEQSFNHKTFFMYAEDEGEIKAILPLAQNKSLLFGNSLCSLPFCVYGGVASISDDATTALHEAAAKLATDLNVDHLELRYMTESNASWDTKDLYVTFRKEIDPDPEVNMLAIPRKQRAMVRKGIKAGLTTEIDDNISRFFDIYSLSVRNHGTPVFKKKFFQLLKENFKDDCEVSVVIKDNVPISSVMSFYFRDEVLPYYGGGTLEARKYKGFDFMYWDLMQRCCQNGIKIFDYGRSKKGTGSYSFKKNWGFEPADLPYQYKLIKATEVPDVNPLNPKYQLFIKMWQKLPLPVANTIGPFLSRSLG